MNNAENRSFWMNGFVSQAIYQKVELLGLMATLFLFLGKMLHIFLIEVEPDSIPMSNGWVNFSPYLLQHRLFTVIFFGMFHSYQCEDSHLDMKFPKNKWHRALFCMFLFLSHNQQCLFRIYFWLWYWVSDPVKGKSPFCYIINPTPVMNTFSCANWPYNGLIQKSFSSFLLPSFGGCLYICEFSLHI